MRHDPEGYNVAHTAGELKPHTDMPSYACPPSVQLIHFLVNRADGGGSVVVDGWRALADLRRDAPTSSRSWRRCPCHSSCSARRRTPLTLHGHRVLHGRLPFDPASGARHLQDVYMEWDDLMARRRVLCGEHRPLPAMTAHAS